MQWSFDDGSVNFGIPVEFAAGARMKLKSVGIQWEDADFDLRLVQTVGMMTGFGVGGGVRVSL